ncbi:hypothetical protein [Xanthobacter dioxanivorans]|uniref:hypothetical protein n=1 Tax=Xanthobacter dioxanivorans TaxID=2528964 RepID=UPI001E5E15C1|nr:hypothetical protein [Xanthobacter dioxanivorans]
MHGIDFSSWRSLLLGLAGLALFTIIGVGIRLLAMFTIRQRRERVNRQINERLRTLITAYKTLGGSFTGTLTVDPTHLRDFRRREPDETTGAGLNPTAGSDRARRIRDAVEAALSDVILLGTEEHVRLAAKAVAELVAGRPVHTHDLVVSLRDFIREALDLDPVPPDLELPRQGPSRSPSSRGKEKGERSKDGAGPGGMGAGVALGGGTGLGINVGRDDNDSSAPGRGIEASVGCVEREGNAAKAAGAR